MLKGVGATLLIGLLAAAGAQAQSPGGYGHGGRGGRSQGDPDAPRSGAGRASNPTPVDQVSIVGVVQAIDPAADRVTIAYEAVDARNWPPGTMPFVVNKPSLLAGVTVGEKVRFKLESEQITELEPFVARSGAADSSHVALPSSRSDF